MDKNDRRSQWYAKNRERILAEAKEARKKDPFLQKCRLAASLANKRYPEKLTVDDVRGIFERAGGVCHWCKKEGLSGWHATLEHLKPINDPKHIVVACYPCNCARLHSKPPGTKVKTPEESALDEQWYIARWKFDHADQERASKLEYYESNKEIVKARSKARHEQISGTDEYRKQRREWYANPKFHKKNIERSRKWREANRERWLEIKRESYRRSKERKKLNA